MTTSSLLLGPPRFQGRIPSLDGLRAVAIVLVLLSHLSGTANFPAALVGLTRLGNFGVRVFFVISGFLITSLLLKEISRTGTIALREFYIRRFFRLMPAFFVFAGTVAILAAYGRVALLDNDLLHTFTYTVNYHHPHSWSVGHIWSLSVEEQFYFIWPMALVLFGIHRGMGGCVVAILAAPLIRVALSRIWPGNHWLNQHFEAVADSLAIGCLLAGCWNWIIGQKPFMDWLRSKWFFLAPLAAIAGIFVQDRPLIDGLIGQSAMNLGIALCIVRWVNFPGDAFGRFLNLSGVRWVGVLSYSFYLWQQLFINRHSSHWSAAFPINIGIAFGLAILSYYLVEKPFLALRDRVIVGRKSKTPAPECVSSN